MKLIKLASLALAAAGIFGVYNAGAAPIGVSTNNTPLNVTITVVTNKADKVSGNKTTYVTQQVKFTNKQLLTLFQNWSSNAWSTVGAKLVVGWDAQWDGDVLVVDKTGTNVLFDASSDGNSGQYFYADFDDETGAYTGSDSDSTYTYTEYNTGDLDLYDDNVYLPYTYIYIVGSSKVTFTEKFGNKPTWSLNGSAMLPMEGDMSLFNSDNGSASGTMKTNGSGKGGNGYWD